MYTYRDVCVCVCVSEAKRCTKTHYTKGFPYISRIKILSVLGKKKNLTIVSDSIYEGFYDIIMVSAS